MSEKIEVIGVRFKEVGKVYYFDPEGEKFSIGDRVIVETSRGIECGEVAADNRFVTEDKVVMPLKKVLRFATAEDLKHVEENDQLEKQAFEKCLVKISEHGLDMKLVDVEYSFDSSKILFFFTSGGRVDFRELVKDLASVFRTRIELRQIGVRDSAKLVGGLFGQTYPDAVLLRALHAEQGKQCHGKEHHEDTKLHIGIHGETLEHQRVVVAHIIIPALFVHVHWIFAQHILATDVEGLGLVRVISAEV